MCYALPCLFMSVPNTSRRFFFFLKDRAPPEFSPFPLPDPLPIKGGDAVFMVEDTEHEGDLVKVSPAVPRGKTFPGRGEDIARRSLVVGEGEVLTPAKVGALAAT